MVSCPVTLAPVRTWVVGGGRAGYCCCQGQRCCSAGLGRWPETLDDVNEFKKHVGVGTPNAGAGSAVRVRKGQV